MKRQLLSFLTLILMLTGCTINASDNIKTSFQNKSIKNLILQETTYTYLLTRVTIAETDDNLSYIVNTRVTGGKVGPHIVMGKFGPGEIGSDTVAGVDITFNQFASMNTMIFRSKRMLAGLTENPDIQWVHITIMSNRYDDYGVQYQDVGLHLKLSRDTLDRIDWDNFEQVDLSKVADEYFLGDE